LINLDIKCFFHCPSLYLKISSVFKLIFFSNKKQVNKSDVFTIQRDELITKEYTFDGNSELEVHLLDAQTKQQLDKTVIKQNKDRDLGGLL